jgi:muramoyltetrapeptide carboxypeptidase
LDKIDYENIKKNPKLFLGYSDITALHIAINKLCGLVTVHGAMPGCEMINAFPPFTRESYLKAVTATEPLGELKNPAGEEIKRLVPGITAGEIIGGNLSLITAAIGTPYEIDTKGKLLFIEDIGEYTYRVDRMLTQLRLAGKFDDCAGIIWATLQTARSSTATATDLRFCRCLKILSRLPGSRPYTISKPVTVSRPCLCPSA